MVRSNWRQRTRTTLTLNTKCQKCPKHKPCIDILGLEMYVKGQHPNNSVLFHKENEDWSQSYPRQIILTSNVILMAIFTWTQIIWSNRNQGNQDKSLVNTILVSVNVMYYNFTHKFEGTFRLTNLRFTPKTNYRYKHHGLHVALCELYIHYSNAMPSTGVCNTLACFCSGTCNGNGLSPLPPCLAAITHFFLTSFQKEWQRN